MVDYPRIRLGPSSLASSLDVIFFSRLWTWLGGTPSTLSIDPRLETPLRAIFISYRRSDSEGEAGRLSDLLIHRFSNQSVFMDVDSIQPGRDFRKAIDESIQACSVVLALIGPNWLDAHDDCGGRRLDAPNDYVRLEIAAALRRDIPVIPVLLRGARMPHDEQLPEEIRDLAFRNSVELTHARWKSDLQVLTDALQALIGDVPTPEPAFQYAAAPGYPPQQDHGSAAAVAQQPVIAASPSQLVSPAAASIQDAYLEKIAKHLAHFIGPIAGVVVKRAARRTTSVEQLYNLLADEIESPADRTQFLTSCKL